MFGRMFRAAPSGNGFSRTWKRLSTGWMFSAATRASRRACPRTKYSRFSCGDVGADDIYKVAGGFEGLLCFVFVIRNKSGVVIESHIPLSAEAVEIRAGQRAGRQFAPERIR